MSITAVKVVSVPVTDQDRVKRFYVDVLGLEAKTDAPFGEGMRWVEVAPKGTLTSVTLVTWSETMSPGSVKGLVLGCENIQATYADLAARGVRFGGPIEQTPWGSFASFDDPNGHGRVLPADA